MNYKRILIVLTVFLIFFLIINKYYCIYEVSRSSMRNTLLDGDFILVRNGHNFLELRDICIFELKGKLLIKRSIAYSEDIVRYHLDSVFVNNKLVELPQSAVHEFVISQQDEKALIESLYKDVNFSPETDLLFDFFNQKVYVSLDSTSFYEIKNYKYQFTIKKSERNIYKLPQSGFIKIPARNIFFIGDNIEHSEDSRHFGPIPEKNIIGKAVLVLFNYHNGKFYWDRFLKKIE